MFENGLVTDLTEFRIDLPVFIATDKVKSASIAIPRPQERNFAYQSLEVSYDDKYGVNTEVLADVDAIFMTEFNKRFPIIVAKSIAKMTVQTVAQAVSQEKLGDWGGIAMSIYSLATTGADLRTWQSLPKNVQIARLDKTDSDTLMLKANGQFITAVNVPKEGNSMVYVRIPAFGVPPVVSVFNL